MQPENMVLLDDFCTSHELEISFVRALQDYGLVEVVTVNKTLCIADEELPGLERMVRLHRELNINAEGLEAVRNLLERIENLEIELAGLRNRLSLYEGESRPEQD